MRENAAPRRFDLVVGADGLHSNVRRLVFGGESRFSAFAGAHLGVLTLPNVSGLDGELLMHVGVGRTAGMYGARHLGDARALFLFRSERGTRALWSSRSPGFRPSGLPKLF